VIKYPQAPSPCEKHSLRISAFLQICVNCRNGRRPSSGSGSGSETPKTGVVVLFFTPLSCLTLPVTAPPPLNHSGYLLANHKIA